MGKSILRMFQVNGICKDTGKLLTYQLYATSVKNAKHIIREHSYINYTQLTATIIE